MMYDAIILAGGLGTRLREVEPNLPKPLASINGRPFLDILVKYLRRSGVIGNITLAIGYKAEMIKEHYREENLLFSMEEKPLGTGGAVAKAILLTNTLQVFVLNGDSFFNCCLRSMAQMHRKNLTLACAYVADTKEFGRVELGDDRRIKLFNEKLVTGPGWINGGIYLFDRKVFQSSLPDVFSLERDFIPQLVEKEITGFLSKDVFIDIGTKDSYLRAQSILKPPLNIR